MSRMSVIVQRSGYARVSSSGRKVRSLEVSASLNTRVQTFEGFSSPVISSSNPGGAYSSPRPTKKRNFPSRSPMNLPVMASSTCSKKFTASL